MLFSVRLTDIPNVGWGFGQRIAKEYNLQLAAQPLTFWLKFKFSDSL